jgi:hypothetical protein
MEGCSECKDEVVMKNRWEVGYMQVDMIVDLTEVSYISTNSFTDCCVFWTTAMPIS